MSEKPQQQHRVLVTGVKGTLARQLVEELLLDARVELVVGTDEGEEPYYFRDVEHGRFLYKQVNVLKARELDNLLLSEDFRRAEVDTVVHMMFIDDPAEARGFGVSSASMNVAGTKLFLERCQELDSVKQFVFLSSYEVYQIKAGDTTYVDEKSDLNFDPEAPLRIQDRVDMDMLCRTQMDSERLKIAVLRPAPIIGRNVSCPLNLFLDSPFCPVPMGYDPMLNPIHARDVVRALHTFVHHRIKGVFNIAGKDIAPLSAFIRMAAGQRLGLPKRIVGPVSHLLRRTHLTRFDERCGIACLSHHCLLDDQHAREAIGFEPKYHVKFQT